jgi:hypothetical protein
MMNYQDALAGVCTAHRDQIERDLETAHGQYEDAKAHLAAAERQLHLLEGLLSMASGPSGTLLVPSAGAKSDDGGMTLHEAMRQVLNDAPTGKLRAGEIIAEIERRGLYRMRDGRIPESQQIHARAGHYPHMFGKDGSYFYAK